MPVRVQATGAILPFSPAISLLNEPSCSSWVSAGLSNTQWRMAHILSNGTYFK